MSKINPTIEIAAKFRQVIRTIAKEDELVCPPSQDRLDMAMHELYLAKFGEKMFKERADKAMAALKDNLTDNHKATVSRLVKTAIDERLTGNSTLFEGQHYNFNVKISAPASRLDGALLKTNLIKHGWTMEMVDKLIKDSTLNNKPSESYSVVPTGEAFED